MRRQKLEAFDEFGLDAEIGIWLRLDEAPDRAQDSMLAQFINSASIALPAPAAMPPPCRSMRSPLASSATHFASSRCCGKSTSTSTKTILALLSLGRCASRNAGRLHGSMTAHSSSRSIRNAWDAEMDMAVDNRENPAFAYSFRTYRRRHSHPAPCRRLAGGVGTEEGDGPRDFLGLAFRPRVCDRGQQAGSASMAFRPKPARPR